MTIALPSGSTGRHRGDLARWTASLAVVLALHGLGAVALLAWQTPVVSIETPPAAIMIDLAPLSRPAPPVVEPPKPIPPESAKRALPEPLPSPAPKPAVILPPPPKVVHRVEPPPKPEILPSPPAPIPPPAQPQQQAVATSIAAPPPAAATPSYQGLLMAKLERNRRYPREARLHHQEGAASLRFTLARDGKLLAFRLEHSSGYPVLDEEVLAMIQRAAPLPPFPPDMPEATLELVVPVRFSLR